MLVWKEKKDTSREGVGRREPVWVASVAAATLC